MRSLLASLTALVIAISGCTVSGAQSWGPAPTADPAGPAGPSGAPGPAATPGSRSASLEVWFTLDSSLVTEDGAVETRSGLFRTTRTLPETTPMVESTALATQAALTALLAGPAEHEVAAGVTSAIPAGTELLGLSIADGLAAVDVSDAFVADLGERTVRWGLPDVLALLRQRQEAVVPAWSQPEASLMLMRLAQVVYTTTQSSTVRRVVVTVEGSSTPAVLEGLDISLEQPLRRDDYRDQLPAILVERPAIGERVSGHVTVSGTANVFEATVSMRILDASGAEIARTFTTATCGTGCRGEYSRRVRFEVEAEQPGTLEVFEASALDGSPINVVRIPLTLSP